MKSFTKFFSFAMLIMFLFSMQNAKADSQRMYLMEGFTSTSCNPCAQTWPSVDPQFVENYDVCIPMKYHVLIGTTDNDPFNKDNPTMHNSRANYYNIDGVPHLRVNGNTGDHPANIATLVPNWNALRGVNSPITLGITEAKNGSNVDVTVKVSSSQALSGVVLRIVLMEYQVAFSGSNGETNHRWIPRDMLPSLNGTAINIGANQSQDVKVSYLPKAAYNASNLYIVAFIQNDATKEVVQAGSNLTQKLLKAKVSTDASIYLKMARNSTLQKVFTVKNPNPIAAEFNLSVGSSSLIPDGVNITLDKAKVTLQPNEETTVTATVASPASAFFSRFFVVATPKASGKIIDSDSAYAYVLTNDAKYACYINYGYGSLFAYNALKSSETYKNDVVSIPLYETELYNQYDPTAFDLAVFSSNSDYASTMANAEGAALPMLTTIDNMLKAKKRIFFMCEGGAYVAYNSETTSNTLKFMLQDDLGIIGASSALRVTLNTSNQITAINKFTINGIKSDPIGQSINTITCNDFSQTEFPYFIVLSDSLILDPEGKGKGFMYTDKQTALCGVRAEVGDGRIVYTSIGLEAIKNATSRNTVALSIIDWLLSDVSSEAKIKFTPEQLDFGRVKINTPKEMTFRIENSGAKPLKISEISLNDEDGIFAFTNGQPTDLPTLDLGNTYDISITFTPKEEDKDYYGDVHIISNSTTNPDYYYALNGTGIGEESIPEIYVPKTSCEFGKVDLGKSASDTFNITNKGSGLLTIENVMISEDEDLVYTVTQGDEGLPKDIAPGLSHKVIVTYTPEVKERTSTAILDISSNDEAHPTISIAYSGTCQDTTSSVNYTNDKNVSLEVLPNPIVNNGTIRLNIADGYKNIVLSVIDASGRKVAELYNGFYSTGKYDFVINANDYSSGAYTVIANINGEAVTVPFIIKK